LYYKYYPSPLAQRQLVEEEERQEDRQEGSQEGRQGQVQDRRQEQVFEMSEQNNNSTYFYQNGIVQLN
jgi:hypothetical protein